MMLFSASPREESSVSSLVEQSHSILEKILVITERRNLFFNISDIHGEAINNIYSNYRNEKVPMHVLQN